MSKYNGDLKMAVVNQCLAVRAFRKHLKKYWGSSCQTRHWARVIAS